MDTTLSIRAFQDGDASALTDLLHNSYAELGSRGLNFTAVDQSVATTLYRARGGRCWVAEQEGEIVATLTVSMPPSAGLAKLTREAEVPDRAWLNQMAVAPHLRRTGVATRLWQLGTAWASAEGATSIGVDTAVPATHLVGLYSSWGFQHREVIHWDGKTYNSAVMILDL